MSELHYSINNNDNDNDNDNNNDNDGLRRVVVACDPGEAIFVIG